ncbi:MAG: class I SAM-dependent methyltransferase [Burkholderiales bacterium]|nr:MAG: class I SAM-dependent methyltransferase [Burkholderiales bacterium]
MANMPFMKTALTLILAPLMALSFAVPGAWSQALPLEEVPFVTTPDNVTLEMLGIAGVGAGDYVLDLGSGDGRIVITAARRFGARGLGVEIVPDLVARSNASARGAGVADRAEFREQDLFKTDLSPATVVTMYLLPDVNLQLRPAILALKPGTRIVSHDWDMGDWKPDRTSVVAVPDKKLGLEKSSKVHLWVVPANVKGTWCGAGLLRGTQIMLEQQYQAFTGTMTRGDRVRKLEGTIAGDTLQPSSKSAAQLVLKVEGNVLRIAKAEGSLALLQGTSFTRVQATSCPA